MSKYGWVLCLPSNGTPIRDVDRYYPESRTACMAVTDVQDARVFDGFMEANDYRSREVNDVWLCESQIKRVSVTTSVQVKLAP